MEKKKVKSLDSYFKQFSEEHKGEIIEEREEIKKKPVVDEFEWESLLRYWGTNYKKDGKYTKTISDGEKEHYDKLILGHILTSDEVRYSFVIDSWAIHYQEIHFKKHILSGYVYTETGEKTNITYERVAEYYLGSWEFSNEFSRLRNEILLRGLRLKEFRSIHGHTIIFRGEEVRTEYIEKYLQRLHTIEQLITFNSVLKEYASTKRGIQKEAYYFTFKQLYTDFIHKSMEVEDLKSEIRSIINRYLYPPDRGNWMI
jgi:hypothetical protein